MKTIGNILWLVLAGVWLAIGYVLAGIINCVFIITTHGGATGYRERSRYL